MNPQDLLLLIRFFKTKLISYRSEAISLFIAFFLTVIIIWQIDLRQGIIPTRFNFIKNDTYWPIGPDIIRVVLWITFSLIILFLWNYFKSLRKKFSNYRFKLKDWPESWVIQGGSFVQNNPRRLLIQMSESGVLFKKYIWKNFRISFQMKYLVDEHDESDSSKYTMRYLGVLFRAINLDSYFMLELIADNGKLYAKPHVRYLGDWEIIDYVYLCPVDSNKFIKVAIKLNNSNLELSIDGKSLYKWVLPTNVDINYKSGKNKNNQEAEDENYKQLGRSIIIPEVPFRNIFGMIGFRAYPGQGATIKGLWIKSLDGNKFTQKILQILFSRS